MGYSNEGYVIWGQYRGDAMIEYAEQEQRIVVRKTASRSGAGVAVGILFGALGRAIMDQVSTGKELATFRPQDIRFARITEKKLQTVFELYFVNDDKVYEIRLHRNAPSYPVLHAAASAKTQEQQATVQPSVELPEPQFLPDPPIVPVRPPVQPESTGEAQQAAPVTLYTPEPPWMQEAEPAYVPAPPPQLPQVQLRVRTGPMTGSCYRCPVGGVVIIGRDPARCNMAMPQYGVVSGAHCRIQVLQRSVMVMDLGSTNGTYVNGIRIPPNQAVEAKEGSQLKLGSDACVLEVWFA